MINFLISSYLSSILIIFGSILSRWCISFHSRIHTQFVRIEWLRVVCWFGSYHAEVLNLKSVPYFQISSRISKLSTFSSKLWVRNFKTNDAKDLNNGTRVSNSQQSNIHKVIKYLRVVWVEIEVGTRKKLRGKLSQWSEGKWFRRWLELFCQIVIYFFRFQVLGCMMKIGPNVCKMNCVDLAGYHYKISHRADSITIFSSLGKW